jgi:hypothetical protein
MDLKATRLKSTEPAEAQSAIKEEKVSTETFTFKTSLDDEEKPSSARKSKRPELTRYRPPGSRVTQATASLKKQDQETDKKANRNTIRVENNESKMKHNEKTEKSTMNGAINMNMPNKPIALAQAHHRPSEPAKLSTISDSSNPIASSKAGGILKLRPDTMRDILNIKEKAEREYNRQEKKMAPLRPPAQDNSKLKMLFDPNNPTKPIYMNDRTGSYQPTLHASASTPLMSNSMFVIDFFFNETILIFLFLFDHFIFYM